MEVADGFVAVSVGIEDDLVQKARMWLDHE
jgi:hypothetical protein